MSEKHPRIAFWGTPRFAVCILDELEKAGFVPELVITAPDRPAGRNLTITPPPVKLWAKERGIAVLQPEKLTEEVLRTLASQKRFDLFIVAAYGLIIPEKFLSLPRHGVLNVHPSLLPKLRGPSPVQTAILTENETGVSIMLLDAEMDHGPVIAQKKVVSWKGAPEKIPKASDLEQLLAHEGGRLLAECIPGWIAGTVTAREQDHARATYTKKIAKRDGLLDMHGDPEEAFRKIRSFDRWPRAHFFAEKNGKKMRVIVTDAAYAGNKLVITKVLPEGGKETDYAVFLKNNPDIRF